MLIGRSRREMHRREPRAETASAIVSRTYGNSTVGAVDGEHALDLVGRDALIVKTPACDGLDEEQRAVADLRGQRDGQHRLVDVGLDLVAARAQADLDLRPSCCRNDCGAPGFSSERSLT